MRARAQAGPLTPASSKLAMPAWHSTAARTTPTASAAPEASPRRMPRSRIGRMPIAAQSRACAGSAERCATWQWSSRPGSTRSSAAEAAVALEPLAGEFSKILFGAGLFGASLLAMAIMPLTTAFALSEAFGFESGVDKRLREAPIFYGIFTAILAIGAIVVMLPGLNPIGAIISSQYLQGLFLPIVLAFIVKLTSSKSLLGEHVSPRWLRLVGWGSVGILAVLNVGIVLVNILGLAA